MQNGGQGSGFFAEGLSFYKLTWVFVLGSLVGTWYEEILTFVTEGVYENRSAVFIGPFNPLYGIAFVLALLLLHRFESPLAAILAGAVFGGALEYAANFAQEFFTGSVSWDYSDRLLNINGRTTLHYALFWGLLSYGMVFYVYPRFSGFIESLPVKPTTVVTRLLIVFLSLNMLITYSALVRQGLRSEGYDAFTPVGAFYDEVFTDAYIENRFPNMDLLKDDIHE